MKEWFRNHTDLMAALLFAGVMAFLVTLLIHGFMLLTARDTEPALAKHLRNQGFIVKVVYGNVEAYKPREGCQFYMRVDYMDDSSIVLVAMCDKPENREWEIADADFQIPGEPGKAPSARIGCPAQLTVADKKFTMRPQWEACMLYMRDECKRLAKDSMKTNDNESVELEENKQ